VLGDCPAGPWSRRPETRPGCSPDIGFPAFREGIDSGRIKPNSPEITQVRFVPLTDVCNYDVFSPHERLLKQDLPRLEPALATDSS
jgi:hypothetical protein